MKKIISLFLALAILTSGFAVFADTFDELADILNRSSTDKFSYNSKVSLTLDAPIELLEIANQALEENDVYIDLSGIVGSFFNMTIDMDMKMNASDDFRKLESEIKMNTNLPLVINNNLKITIDMNMDIYLSFDITDAENPSFSIILTVPVYDKYIVMDSDTLMQDEQFDAEMKEFLKMYAEILSQTASFDTKLYKDFYTVNKVGSTYTITMSDEQFKSLMKKLPEIMFDMNLPGVDELTEEEKLEFDVKYAAIMGVIDNFSILGDAGAVSVCTVNGGKLKQTVSSTSFDFNIYDIASAFMIMSGDYDTSEINEMLSPLTKENSRIAFTIKETDIYSYDSESVKITPPELTEENSVNILKEMTEDVYENDYYNYMYEHYDSFVVVNTGVPTRTTGGFPYLPLRSVFEAAELDSANIGWHQENGTNVVTVKGSDKFDFEEFKFVYTKDGFGTFIIDGNEFTGEGVYISGGVTYISANVIEYLTGYTYDFVSDHLRFDYDETLDYVCHYWFEKYSYPEEEITDSDSFVEEKAYELPVVINKPVTA